MWTISLQKHMYTFHKSFILFYKQFLCKIRFLAIFEGRYSRMTSYCILEIIVWSLRAYTWLSFFLHYSFLSTFFLFFFSILEYYGSKFSSLLCSPLYIDNCSNMWLCSLLLCLLSCFLSDYYSLINFFILNSFLASPSFKCLFVFFLS